MHFREKIHITKFQYKLRYDSTKNPYTVALVSTPTRPPPAKKTARKSTVPSHQNKAVKY
jgi:hypothetical protein